MPGNARINGWMDRARGGLSRMRPRERATRNRRLYVSGEAHNTHTRARNVKAYSSVLEGIVEGVVGECLGAVAGDTDLGHE